MLPNGGSLEGMKPLRRAGKECIGFLNDSTCLKLLNLVAETADENTDNDTKEASKSQRTLLQQILEESSRL